MTRSTALNDGWEFMIDPTEDFFQGEEEAAAAPVRLPHTGTLLPYNYSEELDYQYVSAYRKRLRLPPLEGGRRLFVQFDGAAQCSRLLFNGATLLEHSCGYTAFTAELTAHAREGKTCWSWSWIPGRRWISLPSAMRSTTSPIRASIGAAD